MTAPAHPPLLNPADFDDVVECVTHYYAKPNGYWWWHCLTCNTSTQVRKHGHGHRTEAAAVEGRDNHVSTMLAQRRDEAFRAHWWYELLTTRDGTYFLALWYQRYPEFRNRGHEDRVDEMMEQIQNTPRNRSWLAAVGEHR